MTREGTLRVESAAQISWENLIIAHRKRLLMHARRIVRNQHDAEDIVQTLLYRFWRNRRQLSHISDLERYLVVSVRNQARNFLRSQRKKKSTVDIENVSGSRELCILKSPVEVIHQSELKNILATVNRYLTPAQERLFVLIQDDLEISGRSAAKELGCSHKNVQGLLSRLQAVLRPKVKDFIRAY